MQGCKKCMIKEPLSSPRDHLPLPTPPSLSPIPQARHRDAAASAVFPESSFEDSHKVKTNYLLGYWLIISFGDSFYLWMVGALVYLTLFGIYTVENSWGINWIPRDFTRNIQPFGSSSICVVCDIDETGTRDFKIATKWKTTYLLGCWLCIFSGDGLHLWLLGAII